MAHPRLKPAKPVDPVLFEPAMIRLAQARSLAWTLSQLADGELVNLPGSPPPDTREWLVGVVSDALRAAYDEIEREYRKLRRPESAPTDGGL